MPDLTKRLEQRLVAAVGTPQAGDYNYLADVLEILRDDIWAPDEGVEPMCGSSDIQNVAAYFRRKGTT